MKIEMYTKTVCPYCTRAKNILKLKGFENITEYNIQTGDDSVKQDFLNRTNGAKTVPQIFINDILIGGCDDLMALDKKGELDVMLGLK